MPRKGVAIERNLQCSLQDFYNGTTKKMKISTGYVLMLYLLNGTT